MLLNRSFLDSHSCIGILHNTIWECYLPKYLITTLHNGLWNCSGAVGIGAGEDPFTAMMIRLALVLIAALVVSNLYLSSTVTSHVHNESSVINAPIFLDLDDSAVTKHRHRRRVFLGIFTKPELDFRLRNAIRKTYLREHQQPLKICSIAELQDHHYEADEDCDCDVVYAFINHRPNRMLTNSTKTDRRHRKKQEEKDVIYLDKDNASPLWWMYRYLVDSNMLRIKTSNDSNANAFQPSHEIDQQTTTETTMTTTRTRTTVQFDFVAHTSTNYVLCPDRIWPQELFHGNDIPVFSHPGLCMLPAWGDPSGPLPAGASIEGYGLVSSRLVRRLLLNHHNASPRLSQDERNMGATLYKAMVHSGSIHVVMSTKNSSLSSIYPYPQEQVDTTSIVMLLPVPDSVLLVPKGTLGDLLIETWDAYKDKHLVTYQDPNEEARVRTNARTDLTKCRYGPRILLGIMTMIGNDLEAQRRQLIRETYLSFFKLSTTTTESRRICSLYDLIDKSSEEDHARLLDECQLAYVFVAGGNPEGLKERVDYSDLEPMTVPSNLTEQDIVLLNIRENMKEGKSQTYFKYATTIIDHHLYFDYLAKSDSDTLIFPERFLNHEINRLPSFPDNVRVYGGCNLVSRNDYGDFKSPIYFAGSLYFMSVDLANYVTSSACDRKRMAVYSEDQSMGNFVHSHPLPLHRIKMAYPAAFGKRMRGKDEVWDSSTSRHPLKDLGDYRAFWIRYLGLLAK